MRGALSRGGIIFVYQVRSGGNDTERQRLWKVVCQNGDFIRENLRYSRSLNSLAILQANY
jgi:hypothetical protein